MTREELLHLFEYDRERGVLIWKNPPKYNAYLAGTVAGTIKKKRNTTYRRITIFRKLYSVHQFIWFLEKNEWANCIDHKDGNGLNNHISNLASVSPRMNQQNRTYHRKGKLVGASFHKRQGLWQSSVRLKNGKQKYLGRFNTEFEAHQRYLQEVKGQRL